MAEQQLTPTERSELAELRTKADQLMVPKAYAWTLLRWRGLPVPNLEAMSVNFYMGGTHHKKR